MLIRRTQYERGNSRFFCVRFYDFVSVKANSDLHRCETILSCGPEESRSAAAEADIHSGKRQNRFQAKKVAVAH